MSDDNDLNREIDLEREALSSVLLATSDVDAKDVGWMALARMLGSALQTAGRGEQKDSMAF